MANHLAHETSPYLLQHVNNPVDWYPWEEEALQRAKKENKPILLSIGYSACHWCHVMAHESFEDAETARLMNELFINIKVDREERPDLDKIYQSAHQLLTRRSGGWPLTAFLTPHQQMPFFVGTYFPKQPHYQLPSFKDILRYMAATYYEKSDEIEQQNTLLLDALAHINSTMQGADLSNDLLQRAYAELMDSFDANEGGFTGAPKFPHPTYLDFLLNYACQNKDHQQALTAATHTLTKMAEGGIYDQIGGGFSRYSVDAHWEIPHFEKMLYDNGQLLYQYAQAYLFTKNPLYKKVITETAHWLMNDMQAPEGGYYASLDADSEGHEGKYYVWTPEQVKAVLTEDEYQLIHQHCNLAQSPNFEGRWHFKVTQSLEKIAQNSNQSLEQVYALFLSAQKKLLHARQQRIPPGLDRKILVSWNALAIKGMLLAGMSLENENFLQSAKRAWYFICQHLWVEGKLLASYKDNRARFNAYLDDYAFLLDATLLLLQYEWRDEYLSFALALADALINHFEDTKAGGFFFTANDHETLIVRTKNFADEALPAGNGVAALAFLKLGYLLSEPKYLAIAEKTLQASAGDMQRAPSAYCSSLLALQEYLAPAEVIIVRGKETDRQLWLQAYWQCYSPQTVLIFIPENALNLPPALAQKPMLGNTTAYICQGTQCRPPLTSIKEFTDVLQRATAQS